MTQTKTGTSRTLVGVYGQDIAPYFLNKSLSIPPGDDPGSNTRSSYTSGVDQPRVLVVDDEELIADSVAQILNRNGYHAIARYTGESAIKSVEEQCPDIVICDIIMPDWNGIELAKSVRRQCPATRIILFSGNASTSRLLHDASDEGYSFELLPKPIHPLELLKALKS